MVYTSLIGGSLVVSAVVGVALRSRKTSQLKRELRDVLAISKVETKLNNRVFKPRVFSARKTEYGFSVRLELPKGYALEKFQNLVPTLEQATASKIFIRQLKGTNIRLQLGIQQVADVMIYNDSLVQDGKLTIPYYTHFGLKYLDFDDEATTHLIVSGATRMGKSVFLRLLLTQLILATKGNAELYYINNKVADWYPMKGVIDRPAKTSVEASKILSDILERLKERADELERVEVVNAKQHGSMAPIFIVFDEFGRFSDDEDLQDMVQEIAETAGYLGVHLVIASQRPDATTVFRPRIRANMLARVCFQVADENNSKIVVHSEDAAHLDNVRGRAVILDGMPVIGQIPYLSEEQTTQLLQPYRRDQQREYERQKIDSVPEAFQGIVAGSTSADAVPRSGEAIRDNQSNRKEIISGRSHSTNTKTHGRIVSLHAKSRIDPHGIDED